MPSIDLKLDGDNAWPDLRGLIESGRAVTLMGQDAPAIGVALLKGGMASGKAAVVLRVPLPDGSVVVTETSLALLTAAVRAMNAVAGEEVC